MLDRRAFDRCEPQVWVEVLSERLENSDWTGACGFVKSLPIGFCVRMV